MSSKGKKYKKMVPQVRFHEQWACSNPDVKDGSLCCDGDCSKCEYHYISGIRKEFREGLIYFVEKMT